MEQETIICIFTSAAARLKDNRGICRFRRLFSQRERLSLQSQYRACHGLDPVAFDEFAQIMRALASLLGVEVELLRASDRFAKHWADLDILDAVVGISQKLGIAKSTYRNDFNHVSLETIEEFIFAIVCIRRLQIHEVQAKN